MKADRLAIHGLRLLSGIFAFVSVACLWDPRWILAGMEVGLETPTALAEARAGYGGTFAGLAALFLAGALRAVYRRLALGVAALVLGVFSAGRCVSMAVDGWPSDFAVANQAAEAAGFLLALWLWRASPRETASIKETA